VRSRQRVEISGPVRARGLFFDPDTKRLAIGNVAIGGDFTISERIMLEAGVFTDLSSAQRISQDPDRYYNARIHRSGGTLSMRVNASGAALAAGGTFILGRGDASGVVVDSANLALDYTRTEARSRIFYLHLTGATRAAEELGARAAGRIKKRRQPKASGEDLDDVDSAPTDSEEGPADDD
jgi:hypothetical protein